MRKRKYLGLSLALALTVSLVAVAQGAVTGQKVDWMPAPSPSKQATKKPKGPVSLGVQTEGTYDNLTPGGPAGAPSSHVERATIHFTEDLAYNGGTTTPCTKATINSLDTAGAKAACPNSIYGQGSAKLNGVLGPADAVVTAFRGATPNELLLHARAGPPLPPTTTVLVGTVGPSPKGGEFGQQLDVKVDPIAGGQVVLLVFQTTINKVITKAAPKGKKGAAAAKKKKKKKKKPTYLLSMSCSDKVWELAGDFQFVDSPGGGTENVTLSGSDTAPCQQKKTKKKKKKK
jgi:hypothetical protein